MNTDFLLCVCGNVSHQLVVAKDDCNHDEVFLYIKLNSLPWWERIVHGLKYIFGFNSCFGDFEEIILDKRHISALKRIVDFLGSDGEN